MAQNSLKSRTPTMGGIIFDSHKYYPCCIIKRIADLHYNRFGDIGVWINRIYDDFIKIENTGPGLRFIRNFLPRLQLELLFPFMLTKI